MTPNPLQQLKSMGQSIWLDYIQRNMLKNGELSRLIEVDGLSGMTSNPAIFEKAIAEHDDYDENISVLTRRGLDALGIYEHLTQQDVRDAADLFRSIYDATNGTDGFVSLEVSPHLAYDTEQTLAEARRLWAVLERPNVMIKVPATRAGLSAIETLIVDGININVTLLFSVARYREVAAAFMSGLEARMKKGLALAHVASVASFFVSRIDTLVDSKLDGLFEQGSNKTVSELRGYTAIACACLAYQHYKNWTASLRWQRLVENGAQTQRLLWASTGTKDPTYSDIKYVEALIGADTVNTMPPDTLVAYRDHGTPALRIETGLENAMVLPDALRSLDIDLDAISDQLEVEGVKKFIVPYDKLLKKINDRKNEG